ncbi:MAG TPA: DUF4337 domain-containing protein [Candidatus Bathyarchaeia archaeon]|nr:DUF4337 domain-containing protein [Candidatus Bathyarchaeia archaeon]
MPEEPEVDTDKVREAIADEVEREGGNLLRQIALTTAILAALAAIAALRAGDTANEALALKAEAARLQSEASDKWSYFQAKGIKAAIQGAERAAYVAAGKEPPRDLVANEQRYSAEQTAIQQEAQALERQRDEKDSESNHLLQRHHAFADAVALFQVAIALGAVAALTRIRMLWLASTLIGVAGVGLFVARTFG